jgi:hypothetical protein
MGIQVRGVFVFDVGQGAVQASWVAALGHALKLVVHGSSLGGLATLPVLPAVPASHRQQDHQQHVADEVAVLFPDMLDLVKLFLFFEVEVRHVSL